MVTKKKTAQKKIKRAVGSAARAKSAKVPAKKVPAQRTSRAVAAKPVRPAPAKPPAKVAKGALARKELEQFRGMLVKLRERITGQITSLADDSLKYIDDSSSEDRTDDFDREFALNLVSTEHDALFDIDDALRRIAEGSYGTCNSCGAAIEKVRLQALPFARMCVRCQSEVERGRTRFRPFGDTLSQGAERNAETAEAEEVE